jgi:hypothetical protein
MKKNLIVEETEVLRLSNRHEEEYLVVTANYSAAVSSAFSAKPNYKVT